MKPVNLLVLAAIIALAWLGTRWLARRSGAATRPIFRGAAARAGLFTLLAFTLLALAAPLVTGYHPSQQLDIVGLQNRPPSAAHPLGTDLYSRDVWTRLVYGGRLSLAIGILGMLVALTVGSAVGAVAGYWRGAVGAFLMRLTDVGLAVPRIFVLLVLATLLEGVSVPALIGVIGLTSWFATSRLVRAEVLAVSERPFVSAGQALGLEPRLVIWRHVLPNAAAPIVVSAALMTAGVMLLESALSFLGYGVPAPQASWGSMIADARNHLRQAPWAAVAPGLAIALVVMACNAVAEALRDSIAPRGAR